MSATEPTRAPGTPADWPEFVAGLARTLAGLGPSESLVVEVLPEGRSGPSSYYVQFAPKSGGLHVEAVSNAFLPEPAQLTERETERLEKQGWEAPGGQSPNFWREWPAPVPYEEVATFAAATLRQIYGAQTPDDLREQRVAGSAAAAPLPELTLAPAPDATVESVRAEVERAIHELLGVKELKKDEDGEWAPFAVGSAAIYIRVYGDPPIVQVLSPMLTEVDESPGVLEAVGELNLNVAFAKIVWTGNAVMASIEMFGDPFTPLHLSHAFSVMSALADDNDHLLQQRFGGRTANGDFVPPPQPSRAGGYL